MENKFRNKWIILGFLILVSLFISAVIILFIKNSGDIRENDFKKIELVEEVSIPEEDEIDEVLENVFEELRVFDLETMHPEIKKLIEKNIESYKNNEDKKKFIENVVSNYFINWKDEIIRDALIERFGEYSKDDYEYIDNRTSVKTMIKFGIGFELQIFNIE